MGVGCSEVHGDVYLVQLSFGTVCAHGSYKLIFRLGIALIDFWRGLPSSGAASTRQEVFPPKLIV